MPQLSPAGVKAVQDIAQRHGFSFEAVQSMLDSVINGNGSIQLDQNIWTSRACDHKCLSCGYICYWFCTGYL